MRDLRAADVNVLTLGQYLRPVRRSTCRSPATTTPTSSRELAEVGRALGFAHVESGPLVRSSYHAKRQAQGLLDRRARRGQ